MRHDACCGQARTAAIEVVDARFSAPYDCQPLSSCESVILMLIKVTIAHRVELLSTLTYQTSIASSYSLDSNPTANSTLHV